MLRMMHSLALDMLLSLVAKPQGIVSLLGLICAAHAKAPMSSHAPAFLISAR